MFGKTIRITGLTVLFVLLAASPFATAQTVRYDLSVTIPAIPGVNVPPFDEPLTVVPDRIPIPHRLEMTEELIVRGAHNVILRTYAVR